MRDLKGCTPCGPTAIDIISISSTIWQDDDNIEETASSETRESKDREDMEDLREANMSDILSPLMRHMSSPKAEDYSPRRCKSYSSSPKGPSKAAYPMRRMGCLDVGAKGQPMRRMGGTEEAKLGSNSAEDKLLDLSPPAHGFLPLPSSM
ncbi:hypothetical protein R1sor_004695 [Riccia sorocarpa]|uniref:Uncharacterized protein n=1 Tax=Riccia sorocarpa TaxID=122646 RepID=A0ABD3HLD3_9MARC